MQTPSKKAIHQKCLAFVEERIANAQEALDAATEAANSEDKSSVGDKHETARAMAQLDQESAVAQVREAQDMKAALLKIGTMGNSPQVVPGSLVVTDKNLFYIAIAVGKIEVDGSTVFVISPASPIGQKLIGLAAGAELNFNGQVYKLKEVL